MESEEEEDDIGEQKFFSSRNSSKGYSWFVKESIFKLEMAPCEKCRHNQKRCPADCSYVQYFPAGRRDDFVAVNVVFGSIKFLSVVNEAPEQNLASESLIRHARARIADRVNGFSGTAYQLRNRVNELRAELTERGIPIGGDIIPQIEAEQLEAEQPVVHNGGPCGACRHQRKQCPANCSLRAIFTPQRNADLNNVLALYGVPKFKSNMDRVDAAERRLAAERMIQESRAWNEFPGRGFEVLINTLNQEVQRLTRTLELAKLPFKKRLGG
ncbi:uncharacterized protein LOC113286086 isoform X1 [Papaver somniferum]|uniref:uncharacterized protein LOC113286086 isoform X1 n=1 Tax=Papaver somniferum TaxID=3469 RepID=UPI000E6F9153|nr:uncharacterized protein LOC113286086 isoform X1 [Papaver somniferum]